MQTATLNMETWTSLAALVLVSAAETDLERTLATRFSEELAEGGMTMTEALQTLSVGVTALLTVRAFGSGEGGTTSPFVSGSSLSS